MRAAAAARSWSMIASPLVPLIPSTRGGRQRPQRSFCRVEQGLVAWVVPKRVDVRISQHPTPGLRAPVLDPYLEQVERLFRFTDLRQAAGRVVACGIVVGV